MKTAHSERWIPPRESPVKRSGRTGRRPVLQGAHSCCFCVEAVSREERNQVEYNHRGGSEPRTQSHERGKLSYLSLEQYRPSECHVGAMPAKSSYRIRTLMKAGARGARNITPPSIVLRRVTVDSVSGL